MPKKITTYLKFSPITIEEIKERDKGCFFCRQQYHMEGSEPFACSIMDIMHIVPKSHLGLGVKENGVLGCRYHHSLLDNGNKGLHTEMENMLIAYLSQLYPGWTKEGVTYQKYG